MSEKQPEPRYLAIGRILRPHGVRGELRAEILTDYPERVADLHTLYIGKEHRPYTLKGVRFHQGAMLLTLQECTTRDAAEALRGALVEVSLADAIPLNEGEYYHFQVIGMQVETDTGEVLGRITDVFTAPGANDVFVVHGPLGEILIPVIEEAIMDLDVEAGRVLIHVLPGLLDADEV
ncbi:MAG TPA: ribosome maturation factor RimM [Anaerolineae bacterium]|nr:ribosome maturation factor RimM [Anaerolineae bacterium]HQK13299.1 ribosome maturation factor RimM [Anaerolineae bacterium]